MHTGRPGHAPWPITRGAYIAQANYLPYGKGRSGCRQQVQEEEVWLVVWSVDWLGFSKLARGADIAMLCDG